MFEAKGHSSRTMSPFEIFLRTGLQVKSQAEAEAISLKFNPWHDPHNGQFTTSGGGVRSGGGSFGGGGAAGSWTTDRPAKRPKPQPAILTKPGNTASKPQRIRLVSSGPTQSGALHHARERNGYRFEIDHGGRTRRASGELRLAGAEARSRRNQRQAGGSYRLPSDDGGHYIAHRFGGPSEKFNHFAQDQNFNRGAYRALEDKWAGEIRSGRKVVVDISASYIGNSKRPDQINVKWKIDGRPFAKLLPNRRGGK